MQSTLEQAQSNNQYGLGANLLATTVLKLTYIYTHIPFLFQKNNMLNTSDHIPKFNSKLTPVFVFDN